MSGKQRKHSEEFKFEAIRLARESGKSVAEVAQDLGIRREQLYRWLRTVESSASAVGGKLTSQDEEIRRLRQELRVVREERDILKKATAFFAKASS
jgi:transposase